MTDARSVVVTGASRGLGLATAAHLYREGWTVVAAMRTPADGLERLRALTGAVDGDPRLVAVQLDLVDPESISTAAKVVLESVGPPNGIVHNAGIAAVGALEELPMEAWERMLATNLVGPVRLTKALLPAMRIAGRGRIVVISSQGAVHGMPGISAYSAVKGALERWGESIAQEIAPYGLGVTVLVTGSFKTDILELTETHGDLDGPYGPLHLNLEKNGRRLLRFAGRPDKFAPAVARALDETKPFARRGVGIDARLLRLGARLLPAGVLQLITGRALQLPRPGSLVNDPRRTSTVRSPLREER